MDDEKNINEDSEDNVNKDIEDMEDIEDSEDNKELKFKFYKILGNKLCIEREKRDYTQSQIGQIIGVSEGQVSHYEKGARRPEIFKLNKLAEFYGVSIDYLTKDHSVDYDNYDDINIDYDDSVDVNNDAENENNNAVDNEENSNEHTNVSYNTSTTPRKSLRIKEAATNNYTSSNTPVSYKKSIIIAAISEMEEADFDFTMSFIQHLKRYKTMSENDKNGKFADDNFFPYIRNIDKMQLQHIANNESNLYEFSSYTSYEENNEETFQEDEEDCNKEETSNDTTKDTEKEVVNNDEDDVKIVIEDILDEE